MAHFHKCQHLRVSIFTFFASQVLPVTKKLRWYPHCAFPGTHETERPACVSAEDQPIQSELQQEYHQSWSWTRSLCHCRLLPGTCGEELSGHRTPSGFWSETDAGSSQEVSLKTLVSQPAPKHVIEKKGLAPSPNPHNFQPILQCCLYCQNSDMCSYPCHRLETHRLSEQDRYLIFSSFVAFFKTTQIQKAMIVDILWFADFPWIGIWARNSALLDFFAFFFCKAYLWSSWLQLHHPTSYYVHTLR